MGKETYYKLQANDYNTAIICEDIREVGDKISFNVGDVHPWEVEKLSYTITPVLLTEDEYDSLPEDKIVKAETADQKPNNLLFLSKNADNYEMYVLYVPDPLKSFLFNLQRGEDEGKLLDHIMRLPDGDIGNYKIFQRII